MPERPRKVTVEHALTHPFGHYASCDGIYCGHHSKIDLSRFPPSARIDEVERKLKCKVCGHKGATILASSPNKTVREETAGYSINQPPELAELIAKYLGACAWENKTAFEAMVDGEKHRIRSKAIAVVARYVADKLKEPQS